MEKRYSEDRRREWQWQATDDNDSDSAVLEALCWPCGVYARIQERLRNAIEGRNSIAIDKQPFFNSDCATFCACLPFYGFLIARLQGSIREFYNLDGSEIGDWTDGCFCPPLTLVRDENEIIYRERYGGGYTDPYKPQPPMGGSSTSSSSSSNLNTVPGNRSRRESSRRGSRTRTGLHSIAVDPEYPTEAAVAPHVHYLDQDPTMLATPPADTSHELHQDPTSRQAPTPARKHSLATDHVAPILRPALHHEMHHDEAVAPPKEPTPHDLEGDIITSFPGRPPVVPPPVRFPTQEHELHHDPHVASPPQANTTPHELHHDEIHETPAALQGSRATDSHELHHDEVHPTPPALHGQYGSGAHTLDDDDMVEIRPARRPQPHQGHDLHEHM